MIEEIEAIGRRRVISTSKIKKITAIKKKRRENGRRADPLGSNPHSYGEFFSRSRIVFLDRTEARIMTIKDTVRVRIEISSRVKIIFSRNSRPFDWKSNILLY